MLHKAQVLSCISQSYGFSLHSAQCYRALSTDQLWPKGRTKVHFPNLDPSVRAGVHGKRQFLNWLLSLMWDSNPPINCFTTWKADWLIKKWIISISCCPIGCSLWASDETSKKVSYAAQPETEIVTEGMLDKFYFKRKGNISYSTKQVSCFTLT